MIFWLSSIRQPPPIVSAFPFEDKLLHGLVYALLGLFFFRALRLRRPAVLPAAWIPWAAVVLAAAYGASDEFHQWFVPGRETSIGDWLADGIGACAGVLLASRS